MNKPIKEIFLFCIEYFFINPILTLLFFQILGTLKIPFYIPNIQFFQFIFGDIIFIFLGLPLFTLLVNLVTNILLISIVNLSIKDLILKLFRIKFVNKTKVERIIDNLRKNSIIIVSFLLVIIIWLLSFESSYKSYT